MENEGLDPVDIAFDCLPLRCVSRLDVPLDASDKHRRRCEQIKQAIDQFGAERAYFLYNARCVFRFANSEVAGSCRFEFEGIAVTDASDGKTDRVQLHAKLTSETCQGVPAEVQRWLVDRVQAAVAIEFDRFIASGRRDERLRELGNQGEIDDLANFVGMNL